MCTDVYVFLFGIIGTSPINNALYFSNAGLGTNGQMGSEQSGCPKNISVSGLALVGMDPRNALPQFKRGQR